MIERVAGNTKYLEGYILPDYFIARVYLVGAALERRVCRPGHPAVREGRLEFLDPADMVGVMVGDQNGIQSQMVLGQVIQDRLRLARIHDQRLATGGIRQTPDIVVTERRNGGNGQHRAPHVLIECD